MILIASPGTITLSIILVLRWYTLFMTETGIYSVRRVSWPPDQPHMRIFLLLATLLIGVNGGAQLPITLPEEKPAISIALVAVQDKVKVGSPLILRGTKTNVSDHPLILSHGIRSGPFIVEVRDSENKIPPETDWGYMHNGHHKIDDVVDRFGANALNDDRVSFPLKSGESKVDEFNVLRLYNLTEPGKYTIYLARGKLKSNVITVTLTAT